MRGFRVAACLLMALSYAMGLQAFSISDLFSPTPKETPQTIKVLLLDQVDAAYVEVQGSYNIVDPSNGKRLGTYFSPKKQIVRSIPEGLRWGEEFPGIYQIRLTPDDEQCPMLVDSFQFHGPVDIYQIDQTVSVVAHVDVEEYVSSILVSNCDVRLPSEVLASLAITSRTDAYYSATHGRSAYWDVCAADVGYCGYGPSMQCPAVEEAVRFTRRLVMLNSDCGGRPRVFAARWTENSAGKTVPYQVMYRYSGDAPAQGVTCPFSTSDRERSKWTSSVTKMELAQLANLDRITKINLLRDSASGRVIGVRFEDGQYSKEVDYLALEKYLGKDVLCSSDFGVRVDGDLVTFTGYGSGAGVGLCVYGAERMAERGADARKILNTYYPTAFLELVPPEGLQAHQAIAEMEHEGYRRYAR